MEFLSGSVYMKFLTYGSKVEESLKMSAAMYYVFGYLKPFLLSPQNRYLIIVPYSFFGKFRSKYINTLNISVSKIDVFWSSPCWPCQFSSHIIIDKCWIPWFLFQLWSPLLQPLSRTLSRLSPSQSSRTHWCWTFSLYGSLYALRCVLV